MQRHIHSAVITRESRRSSISPALAIAPRGRGVLDARGHYGLRGAKYAANKENKSAKP
jgi:hypothetical protein